MAAVLSQNGTDFQKTAYNSRVLSGLLKSHDLAFENTSLLIKRSIPSEPIGPGRCALKRDQRITEENLWNQQEFGKAKAWCRH